MTLAAVQLVCTAALAEDAAPLAGGTAGNLKHLAADFGLMGTLLSMALAAIMALFSLYILERPKREAALAKQGEAHTKDMADKDAAHASDRAEWHASTTLLQESRLALMREVLTAIERASSVMGETQKSITERSTTAAQVVDQLAALNSAIHSLRNSSQDEMDQLRRLIRSRPGCTGDGP